MLGEEGGQLNRRQSEFRKMVAQRIRHLTTSSEEGEIEIHTEI